MIKRTEEKKERTIRQRIEREEAQMRARAVQKIVDDQNEERKRLMELDRLEALERKKRRDEYLRAKTLEKIAADKARAESIKAKKMSSCARGEEFQIKSKRDRKAVLEKFDKMKKGGDFKGVPDMLNQLSPVAGASRPRRASIRMRAA